MNKFNWNILSKHREALFGVSILSIMLFHFTKDFEVNNMTVPWILNVYLQGIGSMGVSIFLFLSGMGLFFSYKKDSNNKNFYVKRFSRVVIPYLIIATCFYVILDFILKQVSIWRFFKDLSMLSFWIDGDKQVWFITFILVMYMFFPWIYKVLNPDKFDEETVQFRMVILIAISVIFANVLSIIEPEVYKNISTAILRIPIFVFGCYMGNVIYQKKKISWGWTVYCGISILLCYGNYHYGWLKDYERYLQAVESIAACIILAVLLEVINLHYFEKVLAWFGSMSLELYLTHVLLRTLFLKFGFSTVHIKYEMIMLTMAIILSIGLKKVDDILINDLKKRIL